MAFHARAKKNTVVLNPGPHKSITERMEFNTRDFVPVTDELRGFLAEYPDEFEIKEVAELVKASPKAVAPTTNLTEE